MRVNNLSFENDISGCHDSYPAGSVIGGRMELGFYQHIGIWQLQTIRMALVLSRMLIGINEYEYPPLILYLFNDEPTTYGDGDVFDMKDSEMANSIGMIRINASDYGLQCVMNNQSVVVVSKSWPLYDSGIYCVVKNMKLYAYLVSTNDASFDDIESIKMFTSFLEQP